MNKMKETYQLVKNKNKKKLPNIKTKELII